RSEEQAIAEGDTADDAGWRECDLGYEFDYEDGQSDSGEFTRVLRGADNNFDFTPGSETGASAYFKNGVQLASDPATGGGASSSGSTVNAGSPGWKDSTATTEFASSGAALEDDDDRFL